MALGSPSVINNLSEIARFRYPLSDMFIAVVSVPADSSYPTGGSAFTAATFGLDALDSAVPLATSGGYVASLDETNQKVKMYEQGAAAGQLAEVANATNLDTVNIYFLVIGR